MIYLFLSQPNPFIFILDFFYILFPILLLLLLLLLLLVFLSRWRRTESFGCTLSRKRSAPSHSPTDDQCSDSSHLMQALMSSYPPPLILGTKGSFCCGSSVRDPTMPSEREEECTCKGRRGRE